MEKQKAIYYHYQPDMKYKVYLRVDNADLEKTLAQSFETLGFSKVEEDELKNISIDQFETKILKISEASPRVARQIRTANTGLESFGSESVSNHGNYQIYRHHGVGMMVYGDDSPTWELGVVSPSKNINEIKTMLVRFLSWALAPKGVVGFWAVPVEQGFVVMKPKESNFEAVFVDIDQMAMITQDGVKPITADLQILRLDETLKDATRTMVKEALLSFLTTNTTYFSYHGVSNAMRGSLYELASFAEGIIYPVENFRPRKDYQGEAS